MAVRNVVKVMNFHSLLRVDKARRKAAMYFDTEAELFKIIRKILYNRNIILDKKAITPRSNAPVLNVYIGNDLGFCGDFNFAINKEVRKDEDYKILIGKKIHTREDDDKVVLRITKDEFFDSFKKVEDVIYDGIVERKYREINVVYNHYHNVNSLEFTKKKLFPVDYDSSSGDETFDEDFAMETDLAPMLNNLIALYLCYELKICEMNSYAAENVVRQQLTNESLKKIDEMEEEKFKANRKIKKQKDFQKIIENFRK
ncbi:MAG: F0F1 ATP synthase subunit gamma [Bacilli bacterium]|nr:F0F1 ATP synthase subunit gamma [Bacilli bacterium]